MKDVAQYQNLIHQTWPDWNLEEVLGQGTYGTVFKAVRKHQNHTEYSAIKVMSVPQNEAEIISLGHEGMDEHSIRDYYRSLIGEYMPEIRAMIRLKRAPNIVHIQDYKVIEATERIGFHILIRMELLEGLDHYLESHTPDPALVRRLAADVCRALEECRAFGIIHRDIKPSNIFVDTDGNFKLGDFGTARNLEKTTGGLSVKGTFNYMAPEVYMNRPYGPGVDIYSLGILMYRLCNDDRGPFLPESPSFGDYDQALKRRMSGDTLPPPCEAEKADPELAGIILKACAYKPADRYHTPAEMMAALGARESFSLRRTAVRIAVRTGNAFRDLLKKKKVRRGLLTAAVAVVILCAGTAAMGYFSRQSTGQSGQDTETSQSGNYVSWEDAGLTDHVMDWKDDALESAVRTELGITDGDVMLSDVYDLTEMDLDYSGKNDSGKIKDISALSELTNLRTLKLERNDLTDISALSDLTNLSALYLNGNSNLEDIGAVKNLTSLVTLEIGSTGVSDLSALAGLTKLKTLNAPGNGISDLTPLKNLTNLEILNLKNNQVTDISPLSGLTRMKELTLDSNRVEDIGPIEHMTALELLYFDDNPCTDFGSISELSGLRTLTLNRDQVTDIRFVKGLTNLRTLYLEEDAVTDLSPAAGLTGLEKLYIKGTGIEDDQLSYIGKLSSLTELELADTNIDTIEGLDGLTSLERLDVSDTGVSSIEPVAGFTELQDLDISRTKVTDLSPVANLKLLESLSIAGLTIRDYSPLKSFAGRTGGGGTLTVSPDMTLPGWLSKAVLLNTDDTGAETDTEETDTEETDPEETDTGGTKGAKLYAR